MKFATNQQGMALISALLLMLVVSLMSVGVSMDTSMDVRIAGFNRFKSRSFHFAEAGATAATDILEDNINEAGWDKSPPFDYPNLSASYDSDEPGTIEVLSDGVFYMNDNAGNNPTTFLRMTGPIQATVATQRLVSKLAKGGAIHMAEGYSGLGKGSGGGGVHLVYNFLGQGTDAAGAKTDVDIHFRHVTK